MPAEAPREERRMPAEALMKLHGLDNQEVCTIA